MPEHLGEEDLHAAFGEHARVDAGGADRFDVVDRDAVNAVGHHHPAR